MREPMKLNPAEYSTVMYYYEAPVGVTLEDVTRPMFWQHVTSQLKPGHEVKVVSEDRSFWAHLLVRDVMRHEVFMGVIMSATFEDDIEASGDEDDTYVKWRSPSTRYGVFRKADDECLQDGFETKVAAAKGAATRQATMAA